MAGVLAVLISLTGCGSDEDLPPNVVAKIDDTVIGVNDFKQQFEQLARGQGDGDVNFKPPDFEACVNLKSKQNAAPAGQETKSPEEYRQECEQAYAQLHDAAVEILVQREWIARAAAKLGVKVSPNELRKEFKSQKKLAFGSERKYRQFLASSGRTERNVIRELESNLLQEKLADKVTAGKLGVTAAELRAYYRVHGKEFGSPETRTLRIVLTSSEARATEAKQALDSGQGWMAVAKRYSDDKKTASKGGLLTEVTSLGDKAADEAIAKAGVGEVSEPTKATFGWWVFEVVTLKPATAPPLKSVRKEITPKIVEEKRQKLLDAFAKDFREEYRDQTICADDYKVASCGNGPEDNPTTPAPAGQQQQVQPPPQ